MLVGVGSFQYEALGSSHAGGVKSGVGRLGPHFGFVVPQTPPDFEVPRSSVSAVIVMQDQWHRSVHGR